MPSRKLVSVAILACVLVGAARAEEDLPFLHPLFTEGAVLQRGIECPVWGWTTPGARVTVSMDGSRATATASDAGEWTASIGPFEAGGPHTLSVRGPESVTVGNVTWSTVVV